MTTSTVTTSLATEDSSGIDHAVSHDETMSRDWLTLDAKAGSSKPWMSRTNPFLFRVNHEWQHQSQMTESNNAVSRRGK